MTHRVLSILVIASFLVIMSLALTGCGGAGEWNSEPGSAADGGGDPDGRAEATASAANRAKPAGESAAAGGRAAPAIDQPGALSAVERKIVYRAQLELIVGDLDAVMQEVEELVAKWKGYVARSEVKADAGRRRTASYVLRVPLDVFPVARARLCELGNVERNALDSDDVTEEFVDVQARLKNLREQEEKLNELLREKRKEEKLEDVIRVSDRIAEVRREVERVQGRLNYLTNLTTLATINLSLREVKDYQPPTAPTFTTRAGRVLDTSWTSLVNFVQGAALFALGLTVWLPVLVPAYLLVRWWFRRRKDRQPAAATVGRGSDVGPVAGGRSTPTPPLPPAGPPPEASAPPVAT